jgi:hypothetical protein
MQMRTWRIAAVLAAVCYTSACGDDDGATGDDDGIDSGATGDGAPGDGPVGDAPDVDPDAAPGDDGGAAACGAETCADGDVCVHPCNCGVISCFPVPDSGSCPEGSSLEECPGTGEPACLGCPPPPPPFCAPGPQTCDEPGCECFEADPCDGQGSCGAYDGSDVMCLCA